jgi:O-antigen/teichoic acid export membrane protein
MFTALVFDIQTGLGNTRATVWLNLVWLTALLPALWIGANAGGMSGAAAGHAIVAVTVAIPMAAWMLHRAGVDMRPVLRTLVRPVLAATAAGLAMVALSIPLDAPLAQMLVAGGTGGVVYLLLAFRPGVRAAAWRSAGSFVASHRGARA